MISFVLFSLKRAWQGFWRNAVMSLAATATMVLMLLLLAGFWIIQTGLLAGLQFTEQKVEVVAYLQPNATDTPGRRRSTTQLKAMPEVASVDVRQPRRGARPVPRLDAGPGPRGPDPLPRREPAVREPRGQAGRPVAGPGRRRRAARRPERPQRHQHRGPRRARPDRHEHPADGGHGRPRHRRRHRPVHHHQHDPAGGPRPRRGDRDHAPRRRVGRVHPLAVRVRGRVRRPARVGR